MNETMIKMKLIFLFILSGLMFVGHAQTEEELNAMKAEKQAQVDALQGEIGGIQAKLDAIPGWKYGAFGTIGLNFSNFKDWFSKESPNTSSAAIGFTANAFANQLE